MLTDLSTNSKVCSTNTKQSIRIFFHDKHLNIRHNTKVQRHALSIFYSPKNNIGLDTSQSSFMGIKA